MKVCFLVSANGGNFKFFHLAVLKGLLNNIELCLIVDRECKALHYAKENGIYCKLIQYKRNNNKELINEFSNIKPDIVVTNWHKIIDAETVVKFNGKMINLHYSLLPAFKGLIGVEPIIKAFQSNCQYIGVTSHFVEEEVDSGKIISQAIFRKDNMEIDDAIQKCFQLGCLILLNSVALVAGNNSIIKKEILFENKKFEFSPSLLFDDSIFDKSFWKELSTL